MKVLLFGGSGMVGQGVLRECLEDPGVEQVVSIGRNPLGFRAEKLVEITLPDVTDLDGRRTVLTGFDACFFCLGTSSVGKSESEFRRVTYDLTLRVAERLAAWDPGLAFVYVSGAGTDSTEKGRAMWARVKGATENALFRLPFHRAYMFRPGAILPRHGARSKTRSYRVAYLLLSPILWLAYALSPRSMTDTETVGRAMIAIVRSGAPSRTVDTRAINELGRDRSRSSPG